MKRLNEIVICISFLFLTIFIGGCGIGKEAEVKKSFEKTLSMYPIKNLEDLYDKEGYRDDQFDKKDKGTWTISSEMANQKKGEALNIKGMVLKINRNTRSAKGFYYVNAIKKDENGRPQDNQIEYPVKMVDNKIIPTNKASELLLKGSGNLDGSSVGYKKIEFTFVEKKGENTYYTANLHFKPSEDK
ncbi:TPA: tandem-type lipoprotein [Staphylococcus aureus]|nr:tandem-type lipoprotein [Staphylococcus aureus]